MEKRLAKEGRMIELKVKGGRPGIYLNRGRRLRPGSGCEQNGVRPNEHTKI